MADLYSHDSYGLVRSHGMKAINRYLMKEERKGEIGMGKESSDYFMLMAYQLVHRLFSNLI